MSDNPVLPMCRGCGWRMLGPYDALGYCGKKACVEASSLRARLTTLKAKLSREIKTYSDLVNRTDLIQNTYIEGNLRLSARITTLEAELKEGENRRRNCHDLLLSCWNQFAYERGDGVKRWSGGLSTLEELEYALRDLDLIDDDGQPQWGVLPARALSEKETKS